MHFTFRKLCLQALLSLYLSLKSIIFTVYKYKKGLSVELSRPVALTNLWFRGRWRLRSVHMKLCHRVQIGVKTWHRLRVDWLLFLAMLENEVVVYTLLFIFWISEIKIWANKNISKIITFNRNKKKITTFWRKSFIIAITIICNWFAIPLIFVEMNLESRIWIYWLVAFNSQSPKCDLRQINSIKVVSLLYVYILQCPCLW